MAQLVKCAVECKHHVISLGEDNEQMVQDVAKIEAEMQFMTRSGANS